MIGQHRVHAAELERADTAQPVTEPIDNWIVELRMTVGADESYSN